jgi:general secretion pathway protein A
VMNNLPDTQVCAYMGNTHSDHRNLQRWINLAFGVDATNARDEAAEYEAFYRYLLTLQEVGKQALLIIDEAQNLTLSQLEMIRLLSNVNESASMLLKVALVGQPELRQLMKDNRLRQFAQRISMEFHLTPLAVDQVEGYVHHRLRVAGGDKRIFHPKAIKYLAYHSRGIPRVINNLADMSMVYAYARGERQVSPEVLMAVVKDRSNQEILPMKENGGKTVSQSDQVTAQNDQSAVQHFAG